MIYFS